MIQGVFKQEINLDESESIQHVDGWQQIDQEITDNAFLPEGTTINNIGNRKLQEKTKELTWGILIDFIMEAKLDQSRPHRTILTVDHFKEIR